MGAWGAAAAGDNDGYVGLKVAGVFFNTCGVDEGDRQRRRVCSRAAGGPGPAAGSGGRAGARQGRAALPLPGRFVLRLWKQQVGVEGATV